MGTGPAMLSRADTAAAVDAPPVDAVNPTRTAHICAALEERLAELPGEYDEIVVEATALNQDGLAPVAGDDIADLGTKTVAREQEAVLASAVRDRMFQVERALERLAEGRYGRCEACAEPIPAARLAAFPSATLCVDCKRRQER